VRSDLVGGTLFDVLARAPIAARLEIETLEYLLELALPGAGLGVSADSEFSSVFFGRW
jgi:hypothetical protein